MRAMAHENYYFWKLSSMWNFQKQPIAFLISSEVFAELRDFYWTSPICCKSFEVCVQTKPFWVGVNTSPLLLKVKPRQPNRVAHSPGEQCWWFNELNVIIGVCSFLCQQNIFPNMPKTVETKKVEQCRILQLNIKRWWCLRLCRCRCRCWRWWLWLLRWFLWWFWWWRWWWC